MAGSMRRGALALVVMLLAAGAAAKTKDAKPEGVTAGPTVKFAKGYVDDPFAFDAAGKRLAVVRTDGDKVVEVQILDLANGAKATSTFDLSPVTRTPTQLQFVGDQLFVITRADPDDATPYGSATAALVDLTGKSLATFGPATDLALATVAKKPAVAAYTRATSETGATTHTVTFADLSTGKTIGKPHAFAADAAGTVDKLGLTIYYFRPGYTQIVGKKRGEFVKKKDARMPDSLGVYDVVAGKYVSDAPIDDYVGLAKVVRLRQDRLPVDRFFAVTENKQGVQFVGADDKRVDVAISDEPFAHYDADSLVQQVLPDGTLLFSLTIDPVNADAVARKVSDPVTIDLYRFDPATAKATRIARLPKGDHPFAWQVSGSTWAVLRKHKAFPRGGDSLDVYTLTALSK